MSDLRDFTGKNRKFTGTLGERISVGATAERDASFGAGTIRFNNTSNLMEYYSGTEWKSIDAPPIVNTVNIDNAGDVTSANIDNESSGSATIVIKGSLFDTTGAAVTFIGTSETLSPLTTTRDSSTQITVTIAYSDFDITNSPYTVRVTNGSQLFAELGSAISADTLAPTFTNAVDTNYNIYDSIRSSGTIAAADLIGASNTVGANPYSVTTGSLPTGCTLNSATGDITWSSVSAVGTDTVSTFTITATGDDSTATRQFKITVKAPSATSYTSTGAFTYTVPTGITSAKVLVVAGGGGGGTVIGGGGGAGGMVETTSYPLTPGGTVPGSVGAGGAGRPPDRRANGDNGSPSTFGNITATGGGGGASWSTTGVGSPGGSGGGGTHGITGPSGAGGNSTQSSFAPVGATGYGNPGFDEEPASTSGGGGGGAGTGGPTSTHQRNGGNGRVSNVSGSPVTYAGGGGAGTHGSGNTSGGPGGGGPSIPSGGAPGTANTGGGGGGGYYPPDQTAGSGGSGIVIVTI